MEAQSVDVIIASKLDRLFRSAKKALDFLEEAKSRGISLHFIDLGGDVCNGIGQLVFTILSAVAEQERGRIRERIAEAKERQRSNGHYQSGNIAFGYRLEDGKLVKDDVQQKCLSVLRKKRLTGASYRQLSQYVAHEWGMELSHNAIRVILTGKRKFGITITQAEVH
jgi:DNA invertase Pin-like site-specific DNA recombinase